MAEKQVNININEILNDYSKFTKEEYEVVNTYIIKKEAEYEKKRAERIAITDPKFFVRAQYVKKYGDLALKHKELVINSTMEHLNTHKEILLQLLSILQSLVQNPNVLDTLVDLLKDNWYGNQDFKQFISDLINNEIGNINQLYDDLRNYEYMPILAFLPELLSEENSLASATEIMTEFYNNSALNYPLLP